MLLLAFLLSYALVRNYQKCISNYQNIRFN